MDHNYTLYNGVTFPAIGLGTWKTPDDATAIEALKCAVDAGYRLIDCAAAYGNEKSIGQGIRECGISRSSLTVTSKVWNTDRGYDSTLRAFDRSLSDLGLDYLDLYLIHWPASPSRFDNWRQLNRDTWRAMERLYGEGAVRAIGVSNFMPLHLNALLASAAEPPAVNQIEYHPGFMQPECVELCRANDILVEAWSPLGRGRLASDPTLLSLAEKYHRSLAQICLRWAIQHGVVPLPKSVTPHRIVENIDVWDFTISDSDMALIDALPVSGQSGLDPDTIDF